MPRPAAAEIMLGMHVRSRDLIRRVLIPTAAPPSPSATAPRVRHHLMARMPLYTRPDPAQDRFAHLRRGYD